MPSTRTDKLRAAHDRLTKAVESITSGDDWKRMLKVASKFHRYSFNNQSKAERERSSLRSAASPFGGSAFGQGEC